MSRCFKYLLVACLLFTSSFAQKRELETLMTSIFNFSGYDSKSGILQLQPNKLTTADNIDWSTPGAFKKRKGHAPIDTVLGLSHISLGGLKSAFYSDGTQKMFAVGLDTFSLGAGAIWSTPYNSTNFSGGAAPDSAILVFDAFDVTAPLSHTTFKDWQYFMTANMGVIVTKDYTRLYPLPPPGGALITPLVHAGGELHGEYVYTTRSDGGGGAIDEWAAGDYSNGVVMGPITVDSGRVMLSRLQAPQNDTTDYTDRYMARCSVITVANTTLYRLTINGNNVDYTSDASATVAEIMSNLAININADVAVNDTVTATSITSDTYLHIVADSQYSDFTLTSSANLETDLIIDYFISIYRTRANSLPVTETDSSILIDSIIISVTDTIANLFDTLRVIDSIPDTENFTDLFFSRDRFGRDSTGANIYRYGAPRLDSSWSVDTTAGYGVYQGTGLDNVYGMAYIVSFVDTITGIESDTGRALVIMRDAGDTEDAYKITLPRVSDADSGIVYNLYRAPVVLIGHDTGWYYDTEVTTTGNGSNCYVTTICLEFSPDGETCLRELKKKICPDGEEADVEISEDNTVTRTIRTWQSMALLDSLYVLQYRLVAQLPRVDEFYLDSLRQDSIDYIDIIHPPYQKSTSPTGLDGLFTAQNRLWGFVDNRLYYSSIEAEIVGLRVNKWSSFRYVPISENDGDEIVLAYEVPGGIRVHKNNSTYNVFQDDNGFWVVVEISGNYGCLSRASHQRTLIGDIFLSNYGVMAESEGNFRARQRVPNLLSQTLIEFDTLSLEVKQGMQSIYLPNEKLYIVSGGAFNNTFAYFTDQEKWSPWWMHGNAFCLYRTDDETNFKPPDSVYFSQTNKNVIFRYGDIFTDDGDDFPMLAITAPFFVDMSEEVITRIGLWVTGGSNVDTSVAISVLDDRDSNLGNVYAPRMDTSRVALLDMPESSRLPSMFVSIGVSNIWLLTGNILTDSTIFDRLDVYYQVVGELDSY